MKKFLLSVLAFAFVLFVANAYYKNEIYGSLGSEDDKLVFEVAKGEGVTEIISNLLKQELINSEFFFKMHLKNTNNDSKLQAGSYDLHRAMSVDEIIDVLASGKALSEEIDIKFLEGWTIKDMDEYLAKNNLAKEGIFSSRSSKEVSAWPFEFEKPDFLESVPGGVDFEGYLFPDTYRVFKGATVDDIAKKMFDNLDKKLSKELREEIERQGKTIHEIMTMASIIEKEVITDKDMALVSGVLNKRLEIGMNLEVDSSVNYATGQSRPSVTYDDLQIDSPYNTYKYGGLPPGPICNPGERAIIASVYPKESQFLFYLNRQDTGETIFSRNYNEHIRNKNKYLK